MLNAVKITSEVVASARLLDGAGVHRRVKAPRAVAGGIAVEVAVAFGECPPLLRDYRILVTDVTGLGIVLPVSVAKAVREDLIDNGILRPRGTGELGIVVHQRVAVVDGVGTRGAEAAVESWRVVFVVCVGGAVADDEPVPEIVWRFRIDSCLPEITRVVAEATLVARHASRNNLHWNNVFGSGVEVVPAESHIRDVIVVSAEAKLNRRVDRNSAAGRTVKRIASVMAKTVPFDVAVVRRGGADDAQEVSRWVVGERDIRACA